MTNFRLLDSPLNNPDDDLFEVADYAEKLAEFIYDTKPPFTIGIYGEWGSGKTSFVGFLDYYLKKVNKKDSKSDIKFIKFTAWPYRVSARKPVTRYGKGENISSSSNKLI